MHYEVNLSQIFYTKRDYALVIVDIPHGFNIPNIDYDSGPYTYHSLSKVVARFVEVTSLPLWRFLTFHLDRICNVIYKLQGERKLKDASYMVRR